MAETVLGYYAQGTALREHIYQLADCLVGGDLDHVVFDAIINGDTTVQGTADDIIATLKAINIYGEMLSAVGAGYSPFTRVGGRFVVVDVYARVLGFNNNDFQPPSTFIEGLEDLGDLSVTTEEGLGKLVALTPTLGPLLTLITLSHLALAQGQLLPTITHPHLSGVTLALLTPGHQRQHQLLQALSAPLQGPYHAH